MDDRKKAGRYQRLYTQLHELTRKTDDPLARMASICAVLHHKMDHYFWTGFYMLKKSDNQDGVKSGGKLVVGPYQGPVACQELEPRRGVCWEAVKQSAPVVVKDVHEFPGHIACDSRSQSEITLPVKNARGEIKAVFDVDSDQPGSFSEVDSEHLQKIIDLIYH